MLIDRLGMNDGSSKFPSPVTSSNNDRVPTTGDVHLYADPASYNSKTPILYADCEGLDGGEAVPRGVRHRAKEKEEGINDMTGMMSATSLGRSPRPSTASRASMFVDSHAKKRLKKSRHSSQRDIVWAVTPETKKREYAVTQLYPRLLYTFSDVVVFVLRNPRYDTQLSNKSLLLTNIGLSSRQYWRNCWTGDRLLLTNLLINPPYHMQSLFSMLLRTWMKRNGMLKQQRIYCLKTFEGPSSGSLGSRSKLESGATAADELRQHSIYLSATMLP